MNKQLSFFGQFAAGVTSYGKAISFVFEKGLWIYFIYSIVIAGLLTFFGFELIRHLSNGLETFIMNYFDLESDESMVTAALNIFLTVGLHILFYFIFSTFSKYILLILMSPIMALLSERTEEIITGKKYPFNLLQFMQDILRGIIIALRNMSIEFTFIFLGFLIVWIPIVGWLGALFLIILSYYFYGFSMMDYVSERRRLSISESVRYVRKNKGVAIGNGFIFALLFAIPLVGAMLAAVLAPIAACAAVLDVENRN
ncbi:MAG: EI24 domain-containing protein [Bacteroidetes bacterium]|nr:EI24 domain-containing protein [Bacteroidota bacterium]